MELFSLSQNDRNQHELLTDLFYKRVMMLEETIPGRDMTRRRNKTAKTRELRKEIKSIFIRPHNTSNGETLTETAH